MVHKQANNLMKMAAATLGVCLGQMAAANPAAPTVQVWSQAVVQGDRVCLADLASVKDLDALQVEAMMAIEVADAPTAGNFGHIDSEQIRKALTAADINLANLCITGSATCRVFHPAEPTVEPKAVLAAADMAAANDGVPSQAKEQSRTLEASVREYLDQRLAGYQGRVDVRFGATNRTVLPMAGADMTFHVRSRGNSLLGLTTLDVDVLQGGKIARTIPVLVEVALFKSVVVAVRPINRGAAIRSEDINLQQRRFTRLDDIGLGRVALAVNHQARRFIDRGDMVGVRDVQSLPLVRRGDSVTVWFKRGGLAVSSSAKALKEGAQGERIDVKAEPGGQIYSVLVTGLKTVEAEPSPVRVARASSETAPESNNS